MKNQDAFSGYHPAVQFLYYALVLTGSMCLMHPLYLGISLMGAFGYDLCLRGRRAVRFAVWGLPAVVLPAALLNPAFNHRGATILGYLPSGNPLTLESICYGAAAAVMLACVALWFASFHEIMTSDRFLYLFGKLIPALSLVLSMALRFVPEFRRQLTAITEAQRCLAGETPARGCRKLRRSVTILSILLTWSMENAIETADSMRSRGYGLPGRTAFSIYRFDSRDQAALLWLAFCGGYLFFGWQADGLWFRYYPTLKAAPVTPVTVSFALCYLALCLTPVWLHGKEVRKWNSLPSAD